MLTLHCEAEDHKIHKELETGVKLWLACSFFTVGWVIVLQPRYVYSRSKQINVPRRMRDR